MFFIHFVFSSECIWLYVNSFSSWPGASLACKYGSSTQNFSQLRKCCEITSLLLRIAALPVFLDTPRNCPDLGVDAQDNDAATMLDASWPYQVQLVCSWKQQRVSEKMSSSQVFDNMFCFYFSLELIIRCLGEKCGEIDRWNGWIWSLEKAAKYWDFAPISVLGFVLDPSIYV